jgi:hypothetical protein
MIELSEISKPQQVHIKMDEDDEEQKSNETMADEDRK